MFNIDSVVENYIASWNETDAGRRKTALAASCAADASYRDPVMVSDGHAGFARARVGAAAVDGNGLRHASGRGQVRFRHDDRRGHRLVRGEHGRRRHGPVGDEQREVERRGWTGAAPFDATGDAGRAKPARRGYAARNGLHERLAHVRRPRHGGASYPTWCAPRRRAAAASRTAGSGGRTRSRGNPWRSFRAARCAARSRNSGARRSAGRA